MTSQGGAGPGPHQGKRQGHSLPGLAWAGYQEDPERAVFTQSGQGLEPDLVPALSQVNDRDVLSPVHLEWQGWPFEDPSGVQSIPRRGGITSPNPSRRLCPLPPLPASQCLLAPRPPAPAPTPRSETKEGARMRQERDTGLALGMATAGGVTEGGVPTTSVQAAPG